ncbi:MAG: prepilin-type N-terminal cleavage/methylation domain-containing protein [Actinobacteria bacterium]|nr:prepilin-type N-terminal cleavage/methylation domain-containing protein [Actinomycetota bacterium]
MTLGRRLRADDGFTLVELLTTMAISSVVVAFVTGTVIHALSTQDRQVDQVAALNDTKLAFERVTRDIRRADPLRVVALDRIRLDVLDAGGVRRTLTYERSGDALAVTDDATVGSRTLVADLVPGPPLFRYHLDDGTTATGDPPLDPRRVSSIVVHLKVDPEGPATGVDLETRVLVRNAR